MVVGETHHFRKPPFGETHRIHRFCHTVFFPWRKTTFEAPEKIVVTFHGTVWLMMGSL